MPMKLSLRFPLEARILRPTVVATIAYVTLMVLFFLWTILTLRSPDVGMAPEHAVDLLGPRVAGVAFVDVLTAVNVIWLVVLLMDFFAARRAPAILRRGHVAGVVLGMVVVAVMQFALYELTQVAEQICGNA
jgi:hypothetical protein